MTEIYQGPKEKQPNVGDILALPLFFFWKASCLFFPLITAGFSSSLFTDTHIQTPQKLKGSRTGTKDLEMTQRSPGLLSGQLSLLSLHTEVS